MIKVIINYDQSLGEYKLYNPDLDVMFTSTEMFKVLVLFNSYIIEKYGENVNILKSDEIEYILDSNSMKQMIMSNVKLIKKLSKGPSAFQLSNEKFGNTTPVMSGSQFQSKNKSLDEFSEMMSKPKGKRFSNKFK